MQGGVGQKFGRFNRPSAHERAIQFVTYENQRVLMVATSQSDQRLTSNFTVILGHPSQERGSNVERIDTG
jgi:hypothetical protein